MSEKKPTTVGTKVSIAVILLVFTWLMANGDFSQNQQAYTVVAPKPVATKSVAEQAKWVQPRIYSGVKLYYSNDNTGFAQMRYIGTISDAAGRTIDGERYFGIIMASGSEEYKLREILWNGHWFMDHIQGQEVMDRFREQ